MDNHELHIINAFTHNGKGGNPAGVVLAPLPLPPDERQEIARTAGLSETAFINPQPFGGWKVEFNTPTRPILNCGHATVAAFHLLAQKGLIAPNSWQNVELADGSKKRVHLEGDKVFLQLGQAEHRYLPIGMSTEVQDAVGLMRHNRLTFMPTLSSVGGPFMMLHMPDIDTLRNLKPDFNHIAKLSEQVGAIGVYAFLPLPEGQKIQAAARMFAPAYGIEEEAATGMAAGALAGHMRTFLNRPEREMVVSQGVQMTPRSPSRIYTKVYPNHVISVGGEAKIQRTQALSWR